jgi:hypothetical protein
MGSKRNLRERSVEEGQDLDVVVCGVPGRDEGEHHEPGQVHVPIKSDAV